MLDTKVYDEVHEHYDDVAWLDENGEKLYWIIKEKIKDKKALDQLVNNLLLFYPYLMERGDLRRWAKIADRAVRKIRKRQGGATDDVASVFQVYALNPVAAKRAPPQREHSKRVNQREMLEIYFELMMAQVIDQNLPDLDLVIDSAMKFVRTVNDQYYYGKLYQTLAFIFASRRDFNRALDVATLSYDYFEGTEENLETALTAYAIATCYRGLSQLDVALQWLDTAGTLFTKLDTYPKQYAMISLETAALYLKAQDYDAASQWAEIGLKEAFTVGYRPHIAFGHTLVGQAAMWKRDFDSALMSSKKALAVWIDLENIYQEAVAEHLVAFIEACKGNGDAAVVRLSNVMERAKLIVQSDHRNYIIKKSKRLITGIQNGEDLFALD